MRRRRDDTKSHVSGGRLEAVTFDVTQTLIHAPKVAEIYSRVLHRHGSVVRPKDLRREIPWVWKEMACRADPRSDRFSQHPKGAKGWWFDFLKRLCLRLEISEPTPFAAAELFDRFAQADAWVIYDDVRPTLAALKEQGLRLAVISNWDHRLPELLDRLDLLDAFDAVVYSSSVGVEKPHQRIFRHGLQALDVEPQRCLHVGDQALEDVEGAIAAGMQAVRVDRREAAVSLMQLVQPLLHKAGESLRWPSAKTRKGYP